MFETTPISRHHLFWPCGAVAPAAALALIAALSAPSFAGDQKTAAITAVRGSVMLQAPGSEKMHRAVEGDVVAVGDVIMTGAGSRAQVTLADGSLVLLAGDSASRINQFSFDPATNRRTAVVRVIKGAVRVVVFTVRSPESGLTVQSDTALIISDDLGDYIVIVEKGGTEIVALENTVRVKNALPYVIGEMRLYANQKAVVTEKAPPSSPSAISPDERGRFVKDFRSR